MFFSTLLFILHYVVFHGGTIAGGMLDLDSVHFWEKNKDSWKTVSYKYGPFNIAIIMALYHSALPRVVLQSRLVSALLHTTRLLYCTSLLPYSTPTLHGLWETTLCYPTCSTLLSTLHSITKTIQHLNEERGREETQRVFIRGYKENTHSMNPLKSLPSQRLRLFVLQYQVINLIWIYLHSAIGR